MRLGVCRPLPADPDGADAGPPAIPPRSLIYEEKVDGWRMVVYKAGSTVRLISRNAVEHTRRFPELATGSSS
jgi:ATP-dependent DNA ligase